MNSKENIKENVKRIEHAVCEACSRAGRKRDEILLLPVTKNRDPLEILALYESGYREFGENRVQELLPKVSVLPREIKWHFIGSLQTNKVRYMLDKVSLIHSLDRLSLAEEINKRAGMEKMTAECLVQINISGETTKSGIPPEETGGFLSSLGVFDNIHVCGLMAIGPVSYDKALSRLLFGNMKSKFVDMSCNNMHNVSMRHLSMGMSGDFEEAIECGADIIRIGSAIFDGY